MILYLKEVQDRGLCRTTSEADVEGVMPAKIAILTSLAYGMQVIYEDIHTEGIVRILRRQTACQGYEHKH